MGGAVWGSNPYTSDSNVYKAAKHAGLTPGVFKKILTPGQNSYQGTTQNGITTTQYGPFASSFKLESFQTKNTSSVLFDAFL